MARGGYRPGAGRKPNPNKPKTVAAPKLRQDIPQITAPAEPKKAMPIDAAAWATLLPQIEELSRRYGARKSEQARRWEVPKFPDMAMPKDEQLHLAMDAELKEVFSYGNNAMVAGGGFGALAGEGLLFLGYTYLAELAQRPEYRVIAETIADDSTRKWIDFDVTGDKKQNEEDAAKDPAGFAERMADPDERQKRVKNAGKLDRIKELKDDQLRLGVQQAFYQASRTDNFFGRSHLFLDIRTNGATAGDPSPDPTEIVTDIGDASFGNTVSQSKVGAAIGSFKAIRLVEPMWAYPILYNANDPLRADWYNPQQWYVMGKEIHQSRLLTFVGHPVPDILKPAYAFGGLALSQMVKPYVDIWLQTRQSVAEMIKAYSVMVLGTDLSQLMTPSGQAALLARIALFNIMRDNQGLFVHNKETEEFKNVSAALSGLDHLQAQAQEHMASVARIPLVKLTGISPSGLNATSEFEIEVYDDTIEAYQERFHQPKLQRVVNFQMLSLWGEVDPEITIRFNPLRQVSESEKGEQQAKKADMHEKFVNMGAIAPGEVRRAIVDDEDMPYADLGLDPEDLPEPPAEEGLLSGKGGKGGEQGQGGFNVEHVDEGAQDAAPIAAGVIFKDQEGRVLLVRRSMQEANYKGHWALPGGTADGSETAQQCAVRETLEEIGASISPDGLKEIDKITTPNGMVYTTFLFNAREPFAARLNSEHSAADWFHPHELPDPIHPAVHRVLTTKLGGGAG